MSKQRRRQRLNPQTSKDLATDRQLTILAKHIDALERQGARVYLVAPLSWIREIGAWATKITAQARDN
jgi:hypothetical protein